MRSRGRMRTVVTAALVLGATGVVTWQFADWRDGGASVQSPTDTAPVRPSASATSPPGALVTHDNLILGYRISLPSPYRRATSAIVTGQELLGRDSFTLMTEADERAECLRDSGDIPPPALLDAYFHVEAYGNSRGLSAAEWARDSPRSMHHTVEPATIDGRAAARLVQMGITTSYVIGANDRIYLLALATWPSQHGISDIAATFRALAPRPFPLPTPSQPPREAARALGEGLAQAFSARDSGAVASLMPQCKIGVTASIASVPQGSVLNRSVALFVAALRDRFARGDLTVMVDPDVQVQAGTDQFFVRSTWSERDRTTRIDLFLEVRDGRWQWVLALHHYPSVSGNNCIPFRSPWTSGTAC